MPGTSGNIAEVETFIVGGERWGWVLVRITTEDGMTGIGEGSLEGREFSIAAVVDEFRRYLIGKDASRIAEHCFVLYREAIWSGGPVLQCAISGVEMALWDLKGKRLGAPVYELLGGKHRDSLPLYANGWQYAGGSPDDVATAARQTMAQGYRGLKFNPFNRQPEWQYNYMPGKVLNTGIDYVAAVRDEIGKDAELFIDLNAGFSNIGDVLRIMAALEPFGVAFVEEPLAQENHAALAELRRKSRIPIATGERLFSHFEFANLIAAGAADIVQPDLSHCGGISATMKVAAMAEAAYLPVAPHNPNGPVCESASAHIAMAIPNFMLLEQFPGESWRPSVVGTPFTSKDGVLSLSEAPGLGIDFNAEEALKRPFTGKDLRDFHVRNFC